MYLLVEIFIQIFKCHKHHKNWARAKAGELHPIHCKGKQQSRSVLQERGKQTDLCDKHGGGGSSGARRQLSQLSVMKWMQELTQPSGEFQWQKWITNISEGKKKRILPAEKLGTLLGFQEKLAPVHTGISEMSFQLLQILCKQVSNDKILLGILTIMDDPFQTRKQIVECCNISAVRKPLFPDLY